MSGVQVLNIPGTVKEIKNMAFAGSDLQEIHINSGVEKIYDSAFLACENLKQIVIPSTVTYLGYYSVGFIYQIDFESISYILDDLGISHGTINASNCEYYLENTGYTIDQFMYCAPASSFIVYGHSESIAERYANMSELQFASSNCDSSRVYSAYAVSNGIRLDWNISADATGYKILHKNELGDWEKIATLSGKNNLYYVDTEPYEDFLNEYTVVAYNDKGDAVFDETGVSCQYVKAPKFTGISIKNTTGGLFLSWNYSGMADKVQVYRKTSTGDWTSIYVSSTNLESFTDKSVKYGTRYYYKVKLIRNGATQAPEKEINYTSVQAPTKVTLTNTVAGINIKWNKCAGATKYYVYRKKKGDKSWTRLAVLNSSALSYKDETAKSGTDYIYTVRANNGSHRSAYLTSGRKIKFLSTPGKGGIKSTKNGVQVKYTRSVGATGYYIYRKEGTSGWKRIATVKGNKVLSYTDKSAKKGQTYKYTVRAYNGSYKSSYYDSGQKIKDKY